MEAAREYSRGKVHVVFQPHRYTRTQDLLDEFGGAFKDADTVIVLPIYAASEEPIAGVTAERLAERIKDEAGGPRVEFAAGVCRGCARGCGGGARGRPDFDAGRGKREPTGSADSGGAGSEINARRCGVLIAGRRSHRVRKQPQTETAIRGIRMQQPSRRGFLKAASATAAALVVYGRMPASAAANANGPVKVWSTFGERRHQRGEPLSWKPAGNIAANAIMLNPASERQEMLGFGAALTDAACYVLSQMPQAGREQLMQELFAPDEMALSVCRTCIGASDYSRTAYSFDESAEPDPELTKFSIDHDQEYILPVLRAGSRGQSRAVFVFVAVEPAGLDEG